MEGLCSNDLTLTRLQPSCAEGEWGEWGDEIANSG